MKTPSNSKAGQNLAGSNNPHPNGLRPTTKPMEHRHERRKIREQLRRLDWIPGAEDEIFA